MAFQRGENQSTGSLLRAAKILRCVAGGSRTGLSLAQIIKLTDLPRPTVHRICQMLIDIGWLQGTGTEKRLILGEELATLALTAQVHHPFEAFAYPVLEQLSDETGLPFYIFVRSGNDAVCVARCESGAAIRMLVIDVGTRRPLGIGAGSAAILAALPGNEIEAAIVANRKRFSKNQTFDEALFRAELDLFASRGYAHHNGIFTRGMSGLGVPILDASQYPVAALSTAFITSSLDDAQQVEIATRMNEGARKIAMRLGNNIAD